MLKHVKRRSTMVKGNVFCHIVGGIFHTEGNDFAGKLFYTIHRTLVVGIDDHNTGFFGHPQGKLTEGVFHVVQVLKKVQMVSFYVQNHRRGGAKVQKGVAIFARFQHDHVFFQPHPMTATQNRQIAADHNGRIRVSRQRHVRKHRGGRGFTVGTCHTQGGLVAFHNRTPTLRAFKHRDSLLTRRHNFGVVLVNRGRTNNIIDTFYVFGFVSHRNGNSFTAKHCHRFGFLKVRTAHVTARRLQRFCQRTHGNTADPDQKCFFVGITNIG